MEKSYEKFCKKRHQDRDFCDKTLMAVACFRGLGKGCWGNFFKIQFNFSYLGIPSEQTFTPELFLPCHHTEWKTNQQIKVSRGSNEFPLSIYTAAVYQQLHLKPTELNQHTSDAKRGEIWLAHARASAAAVRAEDCAVTSCDRSSTGSRGGRATAPVLPPS